MCISQWSIAAMAVSLALCVGLPVGLCVAMKRKGASLVSLLLGYANFLVFAMGLEQCLHLLVSQFAGDLLTGNVVFRAIYGGLAAALFEELGRFITFRLFMKKRMNKVNALMFGVGHGGIEALLIGGVNCVTNLVLAIMLNSGAMELTQALLPLQNTASRLFLLTGVERVSAVILQLGMTLLVYRAVRDRDVRYLFLSIGVHFAVDAVTVLCAAYVNMVVLEAVLLVLVCAFLYVVLRSGKEECVCKE